MKIIIGVVALAALAFGTVMLFRAQAPGAYDPQINPADFSTTINSKYFTLTPGAKFVYEADKPEGHERIEVVVLSEAKNVMGVETVVVKDQVFLDGALIEDTRDWYAQDSGGNVWYFGEETAEYENGEVTTTAGSWEAGVLGAKPGIIMKANPQVGDSYRLEYYKGEAEDMAEVLALNEAVTTPYGVFAGCLKTYDYTPLDPNSNEHKYYCREVGMVVLEVNVEDNERTELVSVTQSAPAVPGTSSAPNNPTLPITPLPPAQTQITEAQARAIALAKVSGTVTDIAIETKFGKKVYVIEVKPSYGAETDVIIDIETGAVLAIEK